MARCCWRPWASASETILMQRLLAGGLREMEWVALAQSFSEMARQSCIRSVSITALLPTDER